LTLVQEVTNLAKSLEGQYTLLTFCGHSLGGTAALCMALRIPGSRSISLNAGAAPTNPVLTGPGQSRATAYHIVGDWISSHISDTAAAVIRVSNKNSVGSLWGTNAAHSSLNLLARTGIWKIIDANEEDLLFEKFQNSLSRKIVGSVALNTLRYFRFIKKTDISSPIPGSVRWQLLQVKRKILT